MTATAAETRGAASIPGPPGHPLIGMARALRADLLGTLQRGFAAHGDVVAYRVGPARGPRRLRPLLVAVRHPDDLRRVLLGTDVFVRRVASYEVIRELFGDTIVTLEGARWQRQKRILQPLFTRRQVARYAGLLEAEADRAVARWRQLGDGASVDLVPAMEQYALRVLSRTIFAEQHGADAETAAALERLVPRVGSEVVERMTQAVRPPLSWPTARNRRFRALRAELRETIERVVAQRATASCGGNASGAGDLLSRLRAARDPQGEAVLTPGEVRDEALMFLLAGHTTTADVLISALYLLGRHPAIQERVATAACEATDAPDDLVRAAIQEAMRLYPPSYALGRRAAVDTELGGYAVPAGALVLAVPWATHHDARFWPDPERFDPSRFVGDHGRPPFAYAPFSGGGRACIGRHMAMLESTTLLRALLRSYRLEALDDTLLLSPLISMRPEGPVRVRLHPRRPMGAVS